MSALPSADATDAISATLDILGGKWKIFILSQLAEGTCRFGDLKKGIPAVTQKMLTQQLRELEAVGLVTRRAYPEVPPRVEYTLTEHGQSLGALLEALRDWGQVHLDFLTALQPADLSEAESEAAFSEETETTDLEEMTPAPIPTRQLLINQEELTAALRAASM